jgi:exodeoxyribonuclease-5
VGDHGQLPPIKGSFSLMKDPNLKLERIHRQAQDNPIIKLSIAAREQGRIEPGEYSHTVKKFIKSEYDSQEEIEEKLRGFNNDTLVLCGYNKTRIDLNGFIRNALEIESSEPISTDRVICLKNNHKKQIFNGMLGTIRSINRENDKWYLANIEMDGAIGKFKGLIAIDQFNSSETLNFTSHRKKYIEGDLFDFGYAITVHKAQGSQSKKVILFEERFSKMDDDMWRRWLYTAVTRAEEELYIVGE